MRYMIRRMKHAVLLAKRGGTMPNKEKTHSVVGVTCQPLSGLPAKIAGYVLMELLKDGETN